MSVLDDSEIGRILVIAAHPDDVDFGSAGTIARWTDAGIDVIYCIVTDGDAGGSDPGISRADMATLRRVEQTAAAKQVGVHDLRFLGYPDGRVEAVFEGERAAVEQLLRWCHEGPPQAAVTGVEIIDEEPVGETSFRVQ